MFVYKHTETIEYAKHFPTFPEKHKLNGKITQEFLGLRMRTFQGIVFLGNRIYIQIFKSPLVYL